MQMCIWLEVKKNDQQLWLARGRWTQGPQRVEPCGLERKKCFISTRLRRTLHCAIVLEGLEDLWSRRSWSSRSLNIVIAIIAMPPRMVLIDVLSIWCFYTSLSGGRTYLAINCVDARYVCR